LDKGALTVIKNPKSREKHNNLDVRAKPRDISCKYEDKRDKKSGYKTLTIRKDYED